MTKMMKRAFAAMTVAALCVPSVALADGDLEVRQQALGESSEPTWYPEVESFAPAYSTRVGLFMGNRRRMLTHKFNERRYNCMNPNQPCGDDMEGDPIFPQTPLRNDPYLAEGVRWYFEHQLATECDCNSAIVGYNPMDAATAVNEPFVGATCCTLELVDGFPECTSDILECKDDGVTLRADRYTLFSRGLGIFQGGLAVSGMTLVPAEFSSDIYNFTLNYWAQQMGVMNFNMEEFDSIGATEDELWRAPVAGAFFGLQLAGSFRGANGVMSFWQTTVEEPAEMCEDGAEECTAPKARLFYTSGSAPVLADTLMDGIHLGYAETGLVDRLAFEDPANFGEDVFFFTWDDPVILQAGGLFTSRMRMNGIAPIADLSLYFGVHYYDWTGALPGTPTQLQVIIGSSAYDMVAEPDIPNGPLLRGGMVQDTYVGAPHYAEVPLADVSQYFGSCTPYVIYALDTDGIEHFYPTFGAMQMQLDAEGRIIGNDATCPIWTPDRPALGMLPAGTECNNGDTRSCYTGRLATLGVGACVSGVETCTNGRFDGACAGQVIPAPADTCGDEIDNNCNGSVDDLCDRPTPGEDMGMGEADMGADMGGDELVIPEPGGGGDDDGCCTQVGGSQRSIPGTLGLLVMLGFFGLRRRRAQHEEA